MPYLGNAIQLGNHAGNFKVLDDIKTHTATFDGSASSVVSTSDNTIRIAEHRFLQGQRVTYTNGGGGNIGGLTSGTAYFIIFDSNETFKLATSASNATSNTAINLSAVGSGSSHTLNVAFDGTNTKFKATTGQGNPIKIAGPVQLNIAINNVLQKPNRSGDSLTEGFKIEDNHKIVFATAPSADEVFWGSLIAKTVETFDISDNKIDSFTGDGSTTEFNLSKVPPNNNALLITLDGVTQHPTDASGTRSYSVDGNNLEFTAAPGNGVEIQVRHIGFAGAASGGTVTGFYGRTGNVQLTSTDNIVANDATFSGSVSVGGTLTYEDVKNVDAVGIITARSGIDVDDFISVGTNIHLGNAGVITATSFSGSGANLTGIDATSIKDSGGNVKIQAQASGAVYTGIHTFNSDIDVDGHTNLDNVSIAGVTTITSSTFPLNVHADTNYQGILVNGTNAPTVSFAKGTDTIPVWKVGLSGSDPDNLAFGKGAGNSNLFRLLGAGGASLLGTLTAEHLGIDGYLYHNGDGNTKLLFGTDTIDLQTGGSTRIRAENSGVAITGVSTFTGAIDANGDLDVDGHTNLDNVSIVGVTTISGNLILGDSTGSNRIKLGAGEDLQLYHNSNNNQSYIGNKTNTTLLIENVGETNIVDDTGHNRIRTIKDGAVELFFDNTKRAETYSNGFKINTVTIDSTTGGSIFGSDSNRGGIHFSVTSVLPCNSSGAVVDNAIDLGSSSNRWRNGYFTTLYGDGSNLTGITGTTINNNSDNRIITGSSSANTLNAETNITSDGNNLTINRASGSSRGYYLTHGGAACGHLATHGSGPEGLLELKNNGNAGVGIYGDSGRIILYGSSQYINFGSTVNSSNQLDDYEKGTWTPTINVGTYTTFITNTYIKIGKLVYLHGGLIFHNNSSGTAVQITNIPFTQDTTQHMGIVWLRRTTTDNKSWKMLLGENGTNVLSVHRDSNGNDMGGNLTYSQFQHSSTYFNYSITYRTAQ